MKDRWIALYVENQVGVLAKISGLFAGKSYNLKSLTVGTTEEEDTSRITISTVCDDITFEQIKKQLNRMVEVIKVMDLTDVPIHMKELMFAKVKKLSRSIPNCRDLSCRAGRHRNGQCSFRVQADRAQK